MFFAHVLDDQPVGLWPRALVNLPKMLIRHFATAAPVQVRERRKAGLFESRLEPGILQLCENELPEQQRVVRMALNEMPPRHWLGGPIRRKRLARGNPAELCRIISRIRALWSSADVFVAILPTKARQ